jgi:nitroimidazol reductase NimA-like FMN-containing flavoprotein (pyridoxamine 5'-phosphate oxidase superfamily)
VTDDLELLRRAFADVHTCRVGTVRPDGGPHVAARWFVWRDDALYVATRIGDRTWEQATADPRISVLIDRGRDWAELAGVRVEGVAEPLPAEHPDLRSPMSAWHEKYRSLLSGDGFEQLTAAVPSLGFLRVAPSRIDAWDHRAR